MRTFIAALLIFSVLLAFVLVNAFLIHGVIDGIIEKIEKIPTPDAEDTVAEQAHLFSDVEKEWQRVEPWFSLFISHDDLMEAELQISATLAAAQANAREDYLVSLGMTLYALGHISDMSLPTLKNFL